MATTGAHGYQSNKLERGADAISPNQDWLVDGAMADASVAVVPTQYQANTFPERWQHKITVIHEGVPEAMLKLPRLKQLKSQKA